VNIPVKALKEISQKYGYGHIICFATKGKMQYVATYGTTIQACDEAAQFGDKMKDGLGWPESLHAAPSRVRALQKRVKELEAQLQAAEHGVQATIATDPKVV
jgi:ribosome-binding protein aMBF1 (putative translation factor)